MTLKGMKWENWI